MSYSLIDKSSTTVLISEPDLPENRTGFTIVPLPIEVAKSLVGKRTDEVPTEVTIEFASVNDIERMEKALAELKAKFKEGS